MRMSQEVSSMRPHLLLILVISLTSCGIVRPATIPTQGAESDMNADLGNLAAIKALLARDREQFGHASSLLTRKPHEPFDQTTSMLSSANPSDVGSSDQITSAVRHGLFLIPPQHTQHHQATSVQRLPTQQSSPDYRMHQPPLMPPYTVYAPVGSVYPGSIRCVPDYLGGQRCHNTQ